MGRPFRAKFKPLKTEARLEDLLSKWFEEQLVRGLVLKHLKIVAPALALEFKKYHSNVHEDVPDELETLILRTQQQNVGKISKALDSKNCTGVELKVREKRHGLGSKQNMFSMEEVARIQTAITEKEDIGLLAKQMGRSYSFVQSKIYTLKRGASLKKGKFTVEEVERIRQGVENDDDYKQVAAELGRMPVPVLQKMRLVKTNPGPKARLRGFSVEEDLIILDRIIPQLKKMDLSSSGFFSQTDTLELATEFHRNPETVRGRWERYLQPWLLQHLTGTSGFRVERMLTRFVAQNYKDYRGIDWQKIVSQHKEFAGHTSTSLRQIYHKVIKLYKERSTIVTVEEVAAFAEKVYQPGKEKKELASQVVRREKAVQHFRRKVKELGIKVTV